MYKLRQKHLSLTNFIVLIFCLLLLPNRTYAAPDNIVLRYFRGLGQANGIHIEWATATEFGTAGFEVYRSTTGSTGSFTQLTNIGNAGFVLATGSDIAGADYQVVDNTVTTGQTYWYLLIEIENTGEEVRYDDDIFSIVAGAPTATPTSPPLATNTPIAGNSTAIPTSTNEPTNTPTNTPPPNSTPTHTPTPTNTPLPTNTPTNTPRPVGPTPTPFTFSPTNTPANIPVNTATTESITQANTPIPNQPITTSIPDNSGYPAPTSTHIPPTPEIVTPDTAYVAPTSISPVFPTTDLNTDSNNAGNSSNDLPPLLATQQANNSNTDEGSNTLILWAGFIVGLLLLVAGIAIALQYYKRE